MRGLCGGEGAMVGKQQVCYLVMGMPFLPNEMIAGQVPELWCSLHSPWLPSWSPETPGWGRVWCAEKKKSNRKGGSDWDKKRETEPGTRGSVSRGRENDRNSDRLGDAGKGMEQTEDEARLSVKFKEMNGRGRDGPSRDDKRNRWTGRTWSQRGRQTEGSGDEENKAAERPKENGSKHKSHVAKRRTRRMEPGRAKDSFGDEGQRQRGRQAEKRG